MEDISARPFNGVSPLPLEMTEEGRYPLIGRHFDSGISEKRGRGGGDGGDHAGSGCFPDMLPLGGAATVDAATGILPGGRRGGDGLSFSPPRSPF